MKTEVGRQYTTETTFQDVRDRLEVAFENLKPSTVQGCIDKSNCELEKLEKIIRGEDELESAVVGGDEDDIDEIDTEDISGDSESGSDSYGDLDDDS